MVDPSTFSVPPPRVHVVAEGGSSQFSFVDDSFVTARIISEQGGGRYTLEVTQGGNQGYPEGKTRLIVSSTAILPVGGEVTLAVHRQGEQVILEVVPAPQTVAARAAEFHSTPLTFTLPLGREASSLSFSTLTEGSVFPVVAGGTGAIGLVLPDLTLPSYENFFASSSITLPSAERDVTAMIHRLLATLPEGAHAEFTLTRSGIEQSIKMIAGENDGTSVSGSTVPLSGRITFSPAVGVELHQAVQVPITSGVYPEVEAGLDRQGRLTLSLAEKMVAVSVVDPHALSMAGPFRVEVNPPELALTGILALSKGKPYSAGGQASEGLGLMIQSAGLLVTSGVMAAAEALRSAGLPIDRQNLQLMTAAVAETLSEYVSPSSPISPGAPDSLPLYRAVASLLKQDMPVMTTLIRGEAALRLHGGTTLTEGITSVQGILAEISGLSLPASVSLEVEEARALLQHIPVVLDSNQREGQLSIYLRQMATPQLEMVIERLEGALLQLLEGNPELTRIDRLVSLMEGRVEEGALLPGSSLTLPEEAVIKALFDLSLGHDFEKEAATLLNRLRPENLPAVLSELLAREATLMNAESVFDRLAESCRVVRGVQEQILTAKAEVLAGTRREPGILVAEVPVKMAGVTEEARLQVLYRRSPRRPGENERWSHRVLLDLHTTNLGPVLSELRFSPGRLNIRMVAADEDAVSALQSESDHLLEELRLKGFKPVIEFHAVIPEDESLPPSSGPTVAGYPLAQGKHLDLEA